MLFKKLVLQYEKSLRGGDVNPTIDPIHVGGSAALTTAFRQAALDDVSGAKVFLLDGAAAGYADSFREDLQDFKFTETASEKVTKFLETVEMPSDLVWVEYDQRLLLRDRVQRGHVLDKDYTDPDEFGLRGFLFDNRSPEALRVKLFRTDGDMRIIDPLLTAEFRKQTSGKGAFATANILPHEHMIEFYRNMRISEQDLREIADQERGDLTYDMVLGFVLFALLASPDNGVIQKEKATLSAKEQKTAKKFNKTWMTETLRSHVTIRIGKEAEQHLEEQKQRRAFEASQAQSRSSPVEHWVSEHERRYSNGKIVKIKAHKRGVSIPKDVPTRVMGPRS